MKWEAKPIPVEGDTRYKIKFALFPVRVKDDGGYEYFVWFERYCAEQEYRYTRAGMPTWITVNKLTLDQYNKLIRNKERYKEQMGFTFDKKVTMRDLLNNLDENTKLK